jgi:glycosyltransferase involved in cell wall biosynthesis
MSFLESMAFGVCVIGYRQGGLPDLAVSGEHALFCDAGRETELKDLLEAALQRPREAREMGRRAQILARNYSWLRSAEQLTDFCFRLFPKLRRSSIVNTQAGGVTPTSAVSNE